MNLKNTLEQENFKNKIAMHCNQNILIPMMTNKNEIGTNSFIGLKPFLINDLELNLLEKTLLSGLRIQKLEETSALAKGSDFHQRLSDHMVRNKTYYSPKSQMCHRF